MLTKWFLSNFKAFEHDTVIDLDPMCLISGNNSAGKSTFIQSILLVCQSIGEQALEYGPRLNGNLVKLGNFASIVNKNSGSQSFSLGWKIDKIRDLKYFFGGLESVEVSIKFSNSEVGLYPKIEEYRAVTFDLNGAKRYSLDIIRKSDNVSEDEIDISEFGDEESMAEALRYNVSVERMGRSNQGDSQIIGVKFKGISPSELVYRHDIRRLASGVAMGMLSKEVSYRDISRIDALMRAGIPFEPLKLIYDAIDDNLRELIFKKRMKGIIHGDLKGRIRFYEFYNRIMSLNKEQYNQFRSLIDGELELIKSSVEENVSDEYVIVSSLDRDEMDLISRINKIVFGELVTHIGPLREEPQPFSPLSTARNLSDVGQKGENSAMVLHTNWNKDVTAFIIEDNKYERKTMKVKEFVRNWLKYLDIAEDIKVDDEGQLGYSIKVVKNGMENSLTHVGVGVSQIVPILTSLIVARNSSLTLIEQPELHLHPSTQSKFADFMICMALSNHQVIVETHSEYMIDRVRRRIVEEVDSREIQKLSQILFVDNSSGSAAFEEIEINDFGSIVNWPRGFFDQVDDDNAKITEAKIKKMRNRNADRSR